MKDMKANSFWEGNKWIDLVGRFFQKIRKIEQLYHGLILREKLAEKEWYKVKTLYYKYNFYLMHYSSPIK